MQKPDWDAEASFGGGRASLTVQAGVKALEVYRANMDEAATRTVDVSDEEKRDGDHDWQYQEDSGIFAVRTIAKEKVAENGNKRHQAPCGYGNAIPPGCLRIALRVDHIVHARNDKRPYGRGLSAGGSQDSCPKLILYN